MRVLLPLPRRDFDPTESAVPWRILTNAGHVVVFATPDGRPGEADARMLTGEGLGLFKKMLIADKNGQDAYRAMIASAAFQKPRAWAELKEADFAGLILPGGHAKGMREYLESTLLQNLTAAFFAARKPVGAICHGVVLAARSVDEKGDSVLYRLETTALLQSQELLAWIITAPWVSDYYRTYPETVESEVRRNLASPSQFRTGPMPVKRDTPESYQAGFIVESGNYLSARWPGDAHRFARAFVRLLEGKSA